MALEHWETIATIAAVFVARFISHREHKKTGRDVKEMKTNLNGDFDRRIEEAVRKALKK